MKVLLIALLALGACVQRSAHADCLGQDDCRPPVQLLTLDGAPLGDEALKDHVVLVNFWATWCGPCQREMPALQAVYARHKDEGFTIVGAVASDAASDADVRAFAAQRAVAYPLVRSGPDLEHRFQMGDALPTSLLYDRHGRLVRRWIGGIDEGALEALVARSLALR